MLDRTTNRHAQQPTLSWMLAWTRAQMIVEAHARIHKHTELQARIMAKARARMITEAPAWTFLLTIWAFTKACEIIFLLKVWSCT